MIAGWRASILPALLLALGLVLGGCAGSPEPTLGGKQKSRYQVGRPSYQVAPYQINGVWYYPKVDYTYDETGTASWYGPGFDRQPTSNGEIYDMNGLTAAHKTLPLPSVVEVTNLQNGRALRLRVNDRGPFIGDRLIDVSRRAAQLLGFEGTGTTTARVRIIKEDSIRVAEAAMRGEFGGAAVVQAPPAAAVRMAAAPRLEPRPAPRIAAVGPPSLRAAEVIGSPPPAPAAPFLAAAVPPSLRAHEVVAGPLPAPAPAVLPAAPPALAAAAPRSWPSLISQAHAATRPAGVPAATAAQRPVPAASGNRIFVQAGAFAVPENAQRVRARIAALGSVEVVARSSHGTPLYLVRLGPVSSETQAQRLLMRVVDSGYRGARLVAE
jgi:rare lipoprotein A